MSNEPKEFVSYRASKPDWWIIGIILFFSIGWLLWVAHSHSRQAQGSRQVLIYRQDVVIAHAPLEKDKSIVLLDGRMQVDIKAGKVRVSQADCPHHICIHLGWIRYSGQTIVCAPNKILIEIKSTGSPLLDAVTY
jgi:hypothetical protein